MLRMLPSRLRCQIPNSSATQFLKCLTLSILCQQVVMHFPSLEAETLSELLMTLSGSNDEKITFVDRVTFRFVSSSFSMSLCLSHHPCTCQVSESIARSHNSKCGPLVLLLTVSFFVSTFAYVLDGLRMRKSLNWILDPPQQRRSASTKQDYVAANIWFQILLCPVCPQFDMSSCQRGVIDRVYCDSFAKQLNYTTTRKTPQTNSLRVLNRKLHFNR